MNTSVDLDKVTKYIKRASWTSFPELTLEFDEWERLIEDGNTDIQIHAPGIAFQSWTATNYMIKAARELCELPEPMAGVLLNLAASDQ